jgi:hypothetical protein
VIVSGDIGAANRTPDNFRKIENQDGRFMPVYAKYLKRYLDNWDEN